MPWVVQETGEEPRGRCTVYWRRVVLEEDGVDAVPLRIEVVVPPLVWAMTTVQVRRQTSREGEWSPPTSWPVCLLPQILGLIQEVSGGRDFSGTFGEGSVQGSALPGVHEIVEQAINDREMGTYQRRQGEYLIYPRTEEWVLSEYEWAVRENLFLRQSEIHLRRVLRRYFGETNESLTRRVAEILGDV